LSPTPTQSTKLISWLALQLCFRISLALQNFLKLADQLFQGREIRREIISMMSKAPTPMRKKHSSLSSTSSSTYLLLHTIATRGSKLPKPQSTCRSRMPTLCSLRSSYVDDKYIRSIRSNSVKNKNKVTRCLNTSTKLCDLVSMFSYLLYFSLFIFKLQDFNNQRHPS